MSTYGSETMHKAIPIPMMRPKRGYSDCLVENVLDKIEEDKVHT